MAFTNNKVLVMQRPNHQNPNPYLQVGGDWTAISQKYHTNILQLLLMSGHKAALPATVSVAYGHIHLHVM